MTYDLNGKSVALTGGSRGIGRRVAVQLAGAGARLVVLGRDVAALRHRGPGGRRRGAGCCDPLRRDRRGLCPQRGRTGRPGPGRDRCLHEHAGVTLQKPLLEATDDDVRRVMDTNLLGVLRCCRHAVPFLKARRGVLVNVASIIVSNPFPHMGVYACSKWALAALSHTLRQELHGSGVRVLTVYPAVVRTGVLAQEPVLARTPTQSPEACARAIVRALQKGRREASTAWLPKISGALFKLHAPWCDRINRLFLPQAFK